MKIENNLIKDVKVDTGNAQIQLKLKEKYNKSFKICLLCGGVNMIYKKDANFPYPILTNTSNSYDSCNFILDIEFR